MSRAAGLLALAVVWAGSAAAQTQVYRCGADGRSYSQEPCAHGRALEVADPRSPSQAAQARQAALRDARRADELERARLHAERLAARQGPALIGWSKPAATIDVRCADGAICKPASKRRAGKDRSITQYHGVERSR